MTEKEVLKLVEEAKQKGYDDGIDYMKREILSACESGKPIEIDGKAYFIQSDIEHLRKLMDSFGKDED